jgi:hypothetical protein
MEVPEKNKGQGKEPGGGHPQVRVKYLNSNEVANFGASWTDTIDEVWTRAYGELEEQRKENDKFETDDGRPLDSVLGYTLEQARDEKVSVNRHFAIRSETGGA